MARKSRAMESSAFHLGKRAARRATIVHNSVSELVRLHVEMFATLT